MPVETNDVMPFLEWLFVSSGLDKSGRPLPPAALEWLVIA